MILVYTFIPTAFRKSRVKLKLYLFFYTFWIYQFFEICYFFSEMFLLWLIKVNIFVLKNLFYFHIDNIRQVSLLRIWKIYEYFIWLLSVKLFNMKHYCILSLIKFSAFNTNFYVKSIFVLKKLIREKLCKFN